MNGQAQASVWLRPVLSKPSRFQLHAAFGQWKCLLFVRWAAGNQAAGSESTPSPRPASPPPSEQTEDPSVVRKPRGAGNGRVSKGLAATTPTPALARSSLPEPTAETRQLVDSLFQPGMALTQDQTTQWKQSLTQLVQQGAAAVPAMRQFLARNVDLDFG